MSDAYSPECESISPEDFGRAVESVNQDLDDLFAGGPEDEKAPGSAEISAEAFRRAVQATIRDMPNLLPSDSIEAMSLSELYDEAANTLEAMISILEGGLEQEASFKLYEEKRDYLRIIGEYMSMLICGEYYPKKRRIFAKNPILERIFLASRKGIGPARARRDAQYLR